MVIPIVASAAGRTSISHAWRSLPLLAALVAVAIPGSLAAQVSPTPVEPPVTSSGITVVGVVRDTAGRPVEGAEASIGSEHRAVSDARGTFTLTGVPRQPARLEVRRIGYRPTTIAIAPGTLAAGAPLEVDVLLVPGVVALETVTVEGRAYDRALWDAGFYKRQQRGRGRFVDPDEFARFGGSGIGTLLRETPRVIVERGKGNGEYAYSLSGAGRCRMNVFIDGAFAREAMPSRNDPGVPLSEIISRTGIHAIEIYPTVNSVPTEFTRVGPSTRSGQGRSRIPSPNQHFNPTPVENDDAACGAIVIWTKSLVGRRQAP